MADPQSAEDFARAQEKNYSEWVAVTSIYIDGALAYNPGHPVSSASVNDGTIDKNLVARAGSANAPTSS